MKGRGDSKLKSTSVTLSGRIWRLVNQESM